VRVFVVECVAERRLKRGPNPSTVATRRRTSPPLVRGLKPTATVMWSLRDPNNPTPSPPFERGEGRGEEGLSSRSWTFSEHEHPSPRPSVAGRGSGKKRSSARMRPAPQAPPCALANHRRAVHPSPCMNASDLIQSDPEILGGTPVFKGTRVPVRTLFEYLERDYTLDQFLECFPTVTRAHACAVLERSEQALLSAPAA